MKLYTVVIFSSLLAVSYSLPHVSKIFILSRNSTCFGNLLCPSLGVISCTRDNWYVPCRSCGRCLEESGSKLTWQLVCFMQVTWPLPRRVRFQSDCPRQRPHNLHETYQLPRVQLIIPDDGHRRCQKHVGFRDKTKILYS